MKQTNKPNVIPFNYALQIFWEWRLASICVEVSFFGKARSSETVRVSIDGLVTLVDPVGIVTISGDGREMELDLRGCQISRAREAPSRREAVTPLDPDSILQVAFPGGETCLVFPYRRVAHMPSGQRRAESGLEWLRNKLANSGRAGNLARSSLTGAERDCTRRGRRRSAPPFVPVIAGVFVALLVVLAMTPLGAPKLLTEVGLSSSPLNDPDAPVWVIRQAGNYYCRGSVLAGRKPGQFMKQADALTLGYQPALDHYCGDAGASVSASRRRGVLGYFHNLFENSRLLFSFIVSRSRTWISGS